MKMRLAMGLIGMVLSAQAPAPGPAFEVASIRPVDLSAGRGPGRGGARGSQITGDRLDLRFVSMADLLPYAFRSKDYQVSAPGWVRESMWTISAKLPGGASADQAPDMMHALLVERFKLAVHREKRERAVYTLTVAEGGSKLEKASPGDFPAWDGSFPGFSFRGPLSSGAAITGRIGPGAKCARRWEFVPLPMAALADALTMFLGRPVVDQTGLEGNCRVTLEIPAETEAGMMSNMMAGRGLPPPGGGGARGGRGGPGGELPAPPPNLIAPGCPEPFSFLMEGVGAPDGGIIKALQVLGLKLQQGRAPIDTVVVDHLEKAPTEN